VRTRTFDRAFVDQYDLIGIRDDMILDNQYLNGILTKGKYSERIPETDAEVK
jgi:hypothetical protein